MKCQREEKILTKNGMYSRDFIKFSHKIQLSLASPPNTYLISAMMITMRAAPSLSKHYADRSDILTKRCNQKRSYQIGKVLRHL